MLRFSADESLGVAPPVGAQRAVALFEQGPGPAVVGGLRSPHCDAVVTLFGVVPSEERPAADGRRVLVGEAEGEAGVVLQGLELGFGVGVVVADPGPAQGSGHAKVVIVGQGECRHQRDVARRVAKRLEPGRRQRHPARRPLRQPVPGPEGCPPRPRRGRRVPASDRPRRQVPRLSAGTTGATTSSVTPAAPRGLYWRQASSEARGMGCRLGFLAPRRIRSARVSRDER